MVLPLFELIEKIIQKEEFEKTKENEKKLRNNMENLIILFKQQRDELSARSVYSAVVDLARMGKSPLAHEFARRFEKEIGYNVMDSI